METKDEDLMGVRPDKYFWMREYTFSGGGGGGRDAICR